MSHYFMLQVLNNWWFKRPSEKLVFIHISKTAGTSFRRALEKYYGCRNVFPGKHYLRHLPNTDYMLGSDIVKRLEHVPSHRVLIGHFSANIISMLPPFYKCALLVRDPLQRSLSALAHFSNTFRVPVGELLANLEFVDRNIRNYQTKIIGATVGCDPEETRDASESMLAKATARIDAVAFLGVTEYFAESCRIFDSKFNACVSKYARKTNVLRPSGKELSEHCETILPLIQLDQALYRAALVRFNADLQKLNTA
jgi:hypothetical protein